jgi:hypothetical protein
MNAQLKKGSPMQMIKVWTLIGVLAGHTAYGIETFNIEHHPAIKNPSLMERSVQVQISPRGQKIYAHNLLQILTNLGVVINENYFPAFNYKSDQPISIDEMAKNKPEQFQMIKTTRDFVARGFKGIEIGDFKPAIRLGPSEYIAEFERLAIVTDSALMKKIGRTEGAVLSLEVSIAQLRAQSTDIRINDEANPWLGEIGLLNPVLKIGTKETPLVARLPFYVRVSENGELLFEVLDVEANLGSVPIEVAYRKLLLPSFELRVVGQDRTYQISLEDKEFKKIVDEQIPTGLKLVRDYAQQYLKTELPKLLNQKVKEALKGELEEIQSFPAAGTLPSDTRPPLSLGLKLVDFKLKDSNLSVGLSSFIEDTSQVNAPATALWKNSGARGEPVFNHLNPKDYDFAISVDRVIFNRMIHLSFNRKNFKALETCPGNPKIELLNAPSIDAVKFTSSSDPLSASISIHMHAQIDTPPEQSSGLLAPIKDKFRLSMIYNAKVRPVSPGSTKLGIYPESVDPESVVIDETSLTWVGRLAKAKVLKEVIKVLSSEGSCGTGAPIGEFELINSLWGFPVEYVKIKMESQGQLMLYMNYKNQPPEKL